MESSEIFEEVFNDDEFTEIELENMVKCEIPKKLLYHIYLKYYTCQL